MKAAISGGAALIFGLLLGAAACSSDRQPTPKGTDISGDCLVNSDCAEPLVCAFQRCHAECITTRDCDGTLRCVGAHESTRVCQLELEATCKTSADCALGLVCSSDGACRDHCQSDAECVGEQLCSKGVCAEPSELDASGQLPQRLELRTCRLNSDCEDGQRCAAGSCVAQCVSDRDCATGEGCADGACRKQLIDQCQNDDECSAAGTSCVEGQCRCECLADVDCGAGETCDGCACQAGPPAECVKAEDCADGKQCLDGACQCSCVEDRDCSRGRRCDGCSCVAPPGPVSIHDAILRDATDLARMQGIRDVETTLLVTGPDLLGTTGLEALESVGKLELSELYSFPMFSPAPNPLAGLANLTRVRGDLLIRKVPVSTLELNPALAVGGDVSIRYTSLSCAALGALQQALVANGFKGSFDTLSNGGCSGACVQGSCSPLP